MESFDEPSEPEDEVDSAESTDQLKSSDKHDSQQSRYGIASYNILKRAETYYYQYIMLALYFQC